jgi:hypothetical protein
VTFAASTGMLKLDQPSTSSAEIFGFTGDGTLAGSDQIDLKGINYNTPIVARAVPRTTSRHSAAQ